MARAAQHGHVSAFFWGQAYGGTQEVAAVAALFAIGGTHVFLMRIVPIVLGAVAAVVVWRVGRRTIGELPAVVAGCVMWIWPPYVIWKLDVWHGFYASGLVYSALIMLVALRLDQQPSKRDAAVFGLLLGLAFWQTLQIVPIAGAAIVWLTVRRPGVWRYAWLAAPAALVGALPWLLSNLRHEWWSFALPSGETPYGGRLRSGIDATFPMLIGLRVPASSEWLLGTALSGAVYLALGVVFLVASWKLRRQPASLLFLIVACYPFLYALSGLTWLTTEPRYMVLVSPALAILLAAPATTLPRAALVLAVAGALTAGVLTRWIEWTDRNTAATDVMRVNLAPALVALDQLRVDRVFADYWIAYRITFDTHERVIASEADLASLAATGPDRVLPLDPRRSSHHRHPAYDDAVRASARHAYVLVRGRPNTAADRALLERHGYALTRNGPYDILVSPAQRG